MYLKCPKCDGENFKRVCEGIGLDDTIVINLFKCECGEIEAERVINKEEQTICVKYSIKKENLLK